MPHINLGRTNRKPFTGLIGLIHLTIRGAVTCQSWVIRCSLVFRSLDQTFKNNIYLDSLLLLLDGLWKAQYMVLEEKQNIFSFPSKNFDASVDSLYDEIAHVPTIPF